MKEEARSILLFDDLKGWDPRLSIDLKEVVVSFSLLGDEGWSWRDFSE